MQIMGMKSEFLAFTSEKQKLYASCGIFLIFLAVDVHTLPLQICSIFNDRPLMRIGDCYWSLISNFILVFTVYIRFQGNSNMFYICNWYYFRFPNCTMLLKFFFCGLEVPCEICSESVHRRRSYAIQGWNHRVRNILATSSWYL
ncbi:hypothetical protein ACP275_05G104400 [Erythranthe tilingii]